MSETAPLAPDTTSKDAHLRRLLDKLTMAQQGTNLGTLVFVLADVVEALILWELAKATVPQEDVVP